MQIKIEKKYLKIPVNTQTVSKNVRFYDGDEFVLDLDCKIDNKNPTFTAYVDMQAYLGKTLDVQIFPALEVRFTQSDEMDVEGLDKDPLRPKIHFTVKNGWNNDPNGLLYCDGEYHMFYQYNPCSTEWGNMHWGHAVSRDLLHWTERDVALFPDKTGTMYSGGGFLDEKNVTGLGDGKKPAMLFYYTAAGNNSVLSSGQPFTQRLAYSLDNGDTLVKWQGAPMIEQLEEGNRDPKVVWVEELSKYVLALYLTKHQYGFFISDDLLHWQLFQKFDIAEDWECPDLYALTCGGEKLWVVSGAGGVYMVGRFTSNGFVFLQKEKKLVYSEIAYASQSFSGVKDDRVIKVDWHRTQIPSRNFSQQMGMPYEVWLEKTAGEYYLCSAPVREIESLYDTTAKYVENFALSDTMSVFTGENPLEIRLKVAMDKAKELSLCVYGHVMKIDVRNNKLVLGGSEMPLSVEKEKAEICMLVDKCTIECFADKGKFCMAKQALADYNLPYVSLSTQNQAEIELFDVKILKSVL